MNQKSEARKENKKRRTALILGFSLFATIFLLVGLTKTGTQLTKELVIDGRVLFTFEDRGDYLIVTNNDMISGLELADQLRGNFNVWDRVTKASNSNSVKIKRKASVVTELKIDFQKAQEIINRKREYLEKKRR